jgi:hypothetical protein
VVLEGFDFSVCRLTQRTYAKLNCIAVPNLFLDRQHPSKMAAGAAQPRSEPVDGVLLSEMVGNRDGEGR